MLINRPPKQTRTVTLLDRPESLYEHSAHFRSGVRISRGVRISNHGVRISRGVRISNHGVRISRGVRISNDGVRISNSTESRLVAAA